MALLRFNVNSVIWLVVGCFFLTSFIDLRVSTQKQPDPYPENIYCERSQGNGCGHAPANLNWVMSNETYIQACTQLQNNTDDNVMYMSVLSNVNCTDPLVFGINTTKTPLSIGEQKSFNTWTALKFELDKGASTEYAEVDFVFGTCNVRFSVNRPKAGDVGWDIELGGHDRAGDVIVPELPLGSLGLGPSGIILSGHTGRYYCFRDDCNPFNTTSDNGTVIQFMQIVRQGVPNLKMSFWQIGGGLVSPVRLNGQALTNPLKQTAFNPASNQQYGVPNFTHPHEKKVDSNLEATAAPNNTKWILLGVGFAILLIAVVLVAFLVWWLRKRSLAQQVQVAQAQTEAQSTMGTVTNASQMTTAGSQYGQSAIDNQINVKVET